MTTPINSVTSTPAVSQTGLALRAKLAKQTASSEEAKEKVTERTREKLAGGSNDDQVQLSSAATAAVTQPTPAAKPVVQATAQPPAQPAPKKPATSKGIIDLLG
jgi:hypothetical protein